MQADIFDPKPRLRGCFHAFAFLCTALSAILFFISSVWKRFNFGILIYLLSQLLQYGTSAFYHIPSWPPRIKKVLQYLDHMCIFILIGGTQTSILMNNIALNTSPTAVLLIKISWTIAVVGILKILLLKKLHNIFDLIIYIVQGAIGVPFCYIFFTSRFWDQFFVILGAFLYLTGGIIYGLERPDPLPHVFGFHEIFHIFTIMANMCFGVVISRKYIMSLFS